MNPKLELALGTARSLTGFSLPEDILLTWLQKGGPLSLKRNEVLEKTIRNFKDDLFLVIRGAVAESFIDSTGGHYQLLRSTGAILNDPPNWKPSQLGPPLFEQGGTRAMCPTHLWRIPGDWHVTMMQEVPIAQLMYVRRLRDANLLRNFLIMLSTESSNQRVARFLFTLASLTGKVQGRSVHIPISQRDLSVLCRLTPKTVNIVMAAWKSQGWIRILRGRMEILDMRSLRRESGLQDRAGFVSYPDWVEKRVRPKG
ncbi:MAG: Crp/Fnr family transcriptional regulator [Planctomycetota bacterium]